MSVTITKSPGAVTLIGEPMLFEFTSTNMFDPNTVGNQFFAFLIDNDVFPNGKYVFYNNEARFELDYVAGAKSLEEQLTEIPYVALHYGVTVQESASYSMLNLAYNTKNAKYKIIAYEFPDTFDNFRDNGSKFPVLWDFFRFKVTTYLKKADGSIKVLGTDSITPNADNIGIINVSDYLRNETFSRLDIDDEGDAMREQAGMIAQYYIEIEETANQSGFVASAATASSTLRAMWGGVAWIKQAVFNQTASSWFNEYVNLPIRNFMTYSPSAKTVATAQRERLFFLNVAEVSLKLKCKITYANAATTTKTILTITPKTYTVYALHVGYSELGLLTDEQVNNAIVSYEIWLENASTQITEKRNYTIDRKYYQETRYLYAVNSLGSWETVRLNQSITDASEFERTINNYVVADNYDLQTLASRTQTKRQDSTEASSGWLTKQSKLLMRELLMSRKVYEDLGSGIPTLVNFTNADFANNNKEYLKTETLSYERAFSEDWYSDEVGNLTASDGYFENYFVSYFE